MEEAHGRVRVMTVHASKGLEARIIFLIDTVHNPKGGGHSGTKLIEIDEGDADTAVWVKGEKTDPTALEPARTRINDLAMAESRRLLYVALTRARDRLYIGSAEGKTRPPQGNWRGMIDTALGGQVHLTEVDAENREGRVSQWRSVKAKPAAPKAREASPPKSTLPDWLKTPARADLPRPPPLRPSRLADAAEPPPQREGMSVQAQARLRGDLIHHLLQHLPDVEVSRRTLIAPRLAAARFPALDPQIADLAITDTLALMDDSRFSALFGGSARAEVDIAGRVSVGGKSAEVAGRIDRLVITDHDVTLMDYKTGRPPRDPSDVPENHLRQLAIYEALLRDLYPDRVITTAIIWTALPALVVVPSARLARAMASITLG
jgi:ATP-dependent helicase/nuclease subunit A